ncbi:MAG: tRNA preQ1(34) S-adenosylmethionine ribosyltransferase-isomerase QueA [Candidatus Aminicenantes bacterium]|nr:tRNA preQ1(34) S-adenosylmethionine ribosyltransferase-isomerase QueA [Candidatus Aminicenantes bacterium]MDH5383192.1 tRNA preQ1(34) S-adenosylmethionine ribosyltransferase-isomerase QueA [Candidatus Aminicenantes bacterium]MDH5742692.1 tRNA preQ1(34) S-adenosylmethionine ribosyltransferase-isomerase QueA [Candidatus Aminicenantes bacterium]
MLVSDFDYDLPIELIAQTPLLERDQSRMLVLHKESGEIIHSDFSDIPEYLTKEDILVLNSSKVIPAKIWGTMEDGRSIEFLFLREEKNGIWEVLCRPAKKAGLGDKIFFSKGFKGQIIEIGSEGKRWLQFHSKDVVTLLKREGYAPLPPYIKRRKKDRVLRDMDLERYQTVFARRDGSIAAPTAGLHFTPQIIKKIKDMGVMVCKLSLDVGLATFQPVRAEKVEDHHMLAETYTINPKTAQVITNARTEGQPIFAVGTTSVRALESAFEGGAIRSGQFSTHLFIYPGYEFKVVDKLLTNFHLPRSTLLMLVSAFAGFNLIKKTYQEAVCQKYRFYSYGDCMLII